MKVNHIFRVFVVLMIFVFSSQVFALGRWINRAKVERVMAGTNHSYCLVKLDRAGGTGCESTWVGLDCAGRYWTRTEGELKLKTALLALTTDKPVTLYVDDARKFGNYCGAQRVDIHAD